MSSLIERIEKSKVFWFLLFTSFIFFLLRLPSLFEPYWYGDEGIYQVIGTVLRRGGEMYVNAWDNKPPLLFVIYYLFDGDQQIIRAISLIFGILTTIFYFLLAKKIVGEKISFVITSLFVLYLSTPVLEGNIANTENFMLLPITIAGFLFTRFIQEDNKKFLFTAGLLLGIAFLFKIVAAFDALAFLFFLLYIVSLKDLDRKSIFPKLRNAFIFGIVFLIPIFLVSIYFFLDNNLHNYSRAVLLENFSYVNYKNQFFIPQGLLIIKLIIISVALLITYVHRLSFKKEYLFVLIWFLFSVFNVFFSHRPYIHYLLLLIPSFFLMLGIILKEKNIRVKFLIILFSTLVILLSYFDLYPKNALYYKNFLDFLSNRKDVNAYRSFFDRNTPRDYEIALYIKENTNEEDNIFIWGNNPQTYKLAGKTPPGTYSVIYHITSYEDGLKNTKDYLDKKNPKLIVIMPNDRAYPFSLAEYSHKIDIMGAQIYEKTN
ncbi:MAG: glycosyltransferase family 39 protein [Candidatus Levybacteria bacterium]|nr:glycosyltransferase family 39 protein [Candidatus Levybacteria bacterium]